MEYNVNVYEIGSSNMLYQCQIIAASEEEAENNFRTSKQDSNLYCMVDEIISIVQIIMQAQLQPTQTTDTDNNVCEWQWIESNEAEYSREWDGDIQGYLENFDLEDGTEIKNAEDYTIHNCPEGAMVLVSKGAPIELYWVEETD